jgi:hypothetical protein
MTRLAPCILSLSFVLSISLPFFNRTLVRFSPSPFFHAFALTVLSIPLSMALAWLTRGSQFLCSWTIPSSKTCLSIAVPAAFYAAAAVLGQSCFLHSTLDLTVTSAFLAVAATAGLSCALFADPLSLAGGVALAIVALGVAVSLFAIGGSSTQISLQVAFALCLSASQVSMRKLVAVVAPFETLPVSFMNMWVHIVAAVPLFLLFVFHEVESVVRLSELFSVDLLTLILFGVVSYELFSVCGAALKDCPGYGFAEDMIPLNCLPALLISHVWYGETNYGVGQVIGLVLVHAGHVAYSLGRDREVHQIAAGEGDSMVLLMSEPHEKAVEEE